MRTKQISKNQFLLTITPSEILIMESYAQLFHVSLQDSALVMCVNGWNSYARLILQYNKSLEIQAADRTSQRLLDNDRKLRNQSAEAKEINRALTDISQHERQALSILENSLEDDSHGDSDSMAR